MASTLLANYRPFFLFFFISFLIAMASNLIAMAWSLEAMASNLANYIIPVFLLCFLSNSYGLQPTRDGLQPRT